MLLLPLLTATWGPNAPYSHHPQANELVHCSICERLSGAVLKDIVAIGLSELCHSHRGNGF